jgi:predicted O-methyltransferase YrrM
MCPQELEVLADLAVQLPARMGHVLEIGCWKGLATSALTLGPAPVICIDPFTGTARDPRTDLSAYESFVANMTSLDRMGKIVLLIGRSRDVLPTLRVALRLVLVDGSHAYEDVREDIARSWDLLSDGGVMALDDINWGGVARAIDDAGLRDRLLVVDSDGGAAIRGKVLRGKLGLVVKGRDPSTALPASVRNALRGPEWSTARPLS